MRTKIKKAALSILCVVVLFTGMALPQKTYAIPVIDGPLNALTATGAVTDAANWVTQLVKWAKDELWKTLRDQIVKAIVNEINKQTVAWIQGNGEPKFVSDWKGFLKNAAMEGVNQTISQSQLADLCTPFAFQLQIALIPETKPISQKAKCTISDIVENVEDFYESFENGGWLAYGASTNPENNLYMQLVMFDDDMKARSSLSEEKKKQEAGAGSGFLSVSKCLEDDSEELFNKCSLERIAIGAADAEVLAYCSAFADQNKTCLNEQVQTPGDAVAGAVKNMIGSDNIYVSGVQSIISAAINAGINRMMSEGLALMSGNENPQNGYDPSDQFGDDINAMDVGGKRELTNQVNGYRDQWAELFNLKRQSATYNSQIKTNLDAIKAIQVTGVQCPPLATEGEIAALGPVQTRLDGEVSVLQTKMNDADTVIGKINDANMGNIRQATLVTNAVRDFVARYSREGLITDPGSNYPAKLEAAREEKGSIEEEANLVQTRLQACRTAQGPAATQAAQ